MKNFVQDEVLDYIRDLIPHMEDKVQEVENKCREMELPIVEPEVAQLLKLLILSNKSKDILEIGTAAGYSAILMAAAAGTAGRVTTIERNKERYELADKYIKEAGFEERINLLHGDAADVLPDLDKTFDFAFIDAAKGQYLNFYSLVYPKVASGGILVADNVLFRGIIVPGATYKRRKRTIVYRMREFLDKLKNNPELETSVLPLGDGVALAYKKGVEYDGQT